MGAGNQQGRPDEALCRCVAGFADGEGSFHVAVQGNPSTRRKRQVIPGFHVSQNDGNQMGWSRSGAFRGVDTSDRITGIPEGTHVLAVRDRADLATTVVPFFRTHGLRTTERADFERVARIVDVNQGGVRRRIPVGGILAGLEPSETVRRILTVGEVKIQSELLGD